MPAVANQTLRNDNSMTVVSLPSPGVRFSLRNTTYRNNSLVTLDDIGDGGVNGLLCLTDLTECCRSGDTSGRGALGEWFYPNETALPNMVPFLDGRPNPWDFYRNRDKSIVRMNRRRGGVNGIYRCEIPVSVTPSVVNQNLYIGVYTASTGEWYMYTEVNCLCLE